jgi:hypothetical protein
MASAAGWGPGQSVAAAPPRQRTLRLPIPVTIITGGLGSGKTTAIRHLVAAKPPHEVWALLVNEMGAVGVDGAAVEAAAAAGTVAVRQIAGGCLCCAAAGLLTPAIAQLLRQVKPDRWGRRSGAPGLRRAAGLGTSFEASGRARREARAVDHAHARSASLRLAVHALACHAPPATTGC